MRGGRSDSPSVKFESGPTRLHGFLSLAIPDTGGRFLRIFNDTVGVFAGNAGVHNSYPVADDH